MQRGYVAVLPYIPQNIAPMVNFQYEGVHGFLRQMEHFLSDMSNRVEHQKLNQTTAELSFG